MKKKATQAREKEEKGVFDELLNTDARAALTRAYEMKQETSAQLEGQMEQFKLFDRKARLDDNISEDERAEYQRFAAERNRLMEEQKKWENRETDAAKKIKEDSVSGAGAVSAWSAAVLDMMIGQGPDYEKQTAKNTKKSTDLLQKLVEQSDIVDATYG